MCCSLGTPEPNLLREGSIADRIFSLRNCEVRFEAFPWIKLNASVAETACYPHPGDPARLL